MSLAEVDAVDICFWLFSFNLDSAVGGAYMVQDIGLAGIAQQDAVT